MSFQDTLRLGGQTTVIISRIGFGSTFNETAALVECALFDNREDIVGGVQFPDLPHFLNVNFVKRVFNSDCTGLAVAEEEVTLRSFAGLPEGRQWSFQSLFGHVEIFAIFGQHQSNEPCILDNFCMRGEVPSSSG
jgi:hypothetical protein